MANYCIPVEQVHVLQVTRPSPTGIRGWLREINVVIQLCIAYNVVILQWTMISPGSSPYSLVISC